MTLPTKIDSSKPRRASRGRLVVVTLGIVAIFIICVAAIFWTLARIAPGRSAPTSSSDQEVKKIDQPIKQEEPIRDSDRDGIVDSQELLIHTDQLNPDTDNDGLSDGEEVRIYETDPLSADTDGDGYEDGDEVHHGYNPTGPGRLSIPDIGQ